MASTYIYFPIRENEIRLFFLFPSNSSEAQLECEIKTYEREKAPEFEAVSYVWGDNEDGLTLLKVRDAKQGPARQFLVGHNLACALKKFRPSSMQEKRVLWCDAICMDQNNKIELSQQVPLMEKTYSHATRVLVWLGDATNTSTKAVGFMHKMLSMGTNFDDLLKGGYADEWAAFESLMRMPWFTRRWIVQEIALAKDANIYCGNDEISWGEFCDCVALFELYYPDIRPSFLTQKHHFSRNWLGEVQALGACRLVHVTGNLFRKSSDGTIQRRLVTLESLVSTLTMFNARNPHDLVYAMVALAKDITTVAQNRNSVLLDALPVVTPRSEYEEEPNFDVTEEPPKKRKKTRSDPTLVHVTNVLLDQHRRQNSQRVDDTKRRKTAAMVQSAVKDLQSTGTVPRAFRVDYQQTFLRVCMDFVAFAIMQSHSLDIICRPWVPERVKSECDLPSWLVDSETCPFRPRDDGTFVRVNGDPFVGQNAMEAKRYSACGPRSQARRVTQINPENGWGFGFFHRESRFKDPPGEHRSLFVSGFVLDTIDEIKDKAEDGMIPNEWFGFGDWHDQSSLPPDPFWRTLAGDRESDGTYVGSFYQRTLRDTIQRHRAPRSAFNVKAILATPQCDRRTEKVLNRILAVIPNRRLFRTTSDTHRVLGLAPAKAIKGDKICILFGCSVPVVLRPRSADIEGTECEYYEFLGDAYLHGLMEGDALDERERLNRRLEQFELR